MNKKMIIRNMESSMFMIKSKLLESAELRKLLFHTTPDALDLAEPVKDDVKNRIDLTSIIDYQLENTNSVANFVLVELSSMDLSNGDFAGHNIMVSAFSKHSNVSLNGNRMRHFAIAQEIYSILTELSIGALGKLELLEMELKTIDSGYVGYQMSFLAIDTTEVDNF